MARPTSSKRAHFRAALIALVLFVEGVEAMPRSALSLDKLQRPEGQRFLGWIERSLALVGAQPGRERIASQLVAASGALVETRNLLLAPFAPLFGLTSTGQQWTLFINVGREFFRLHIDAAGADQRFKSVYRALDHDPEGLAPLLAYRRLRGIYDPRRKRGPSEEYAGFGHFVAEIFFARQPELVTVRLCMERIRVGPPGSTPQTLGFEHELIEQRPQP